MGKASAAGGSKTETVGSGRGWGMTMGSRSSLAGMKEGSVNGAHAESRAWVASRVGKMAAAGSRAGGMENGGNEACRPRIMWASWCSRYMSCITSLNSFQLMGSARASQMAAQVFQDDSSV